MKLTKTLGHLKHTIEETLTLEADDTGNLHWCIDAAFEVCNHMKSHTGSTFTTGKGVISSISEKQKVNNMSSTEGELTGIDDNTSKVIWSKKFIEKQGFKINLCMTFQDNMSTIKLIKNGRRSAGKRTRYFCIRLFCAKDCIDMKEVTMQCFPAK